MEEGQKIKSAGTQNYDKYVVTSVQDTTQDDVDRITRAGFMYHGIQYTRHVWSVPDNVSVAHRAQFGVQMVTYSDSAGDALFQVFTKRKGCFCSEFHWDPYKGGDYSAVAWPGDEQWDDMPPMPQLKPKTQVMLDKEQHRREQYAVERAARKARIAARPPRESATPFEAASASTFVRRGIGASVEHTLQTKAKGQQTFLDDLAEMSEAMEEVAHYETVSRIIMEEKE